MGGPKASPVVVVVAVVALIGFIGWQGFIYFGPDQKVHTPLSDRIDKMIHDYAKKSGNDFSKLTPVEQAEVNKATAGWGAMAIKMQPKDP